jgi:hypothetical protein
MPNCETLSSGHAEERACWIKAAEQSSADVQAAQKLHRERIKRWSEDAAYMERSLMLFDESTQQFSRYRQSQCEFEASAAAGGNSAGDIRLKCQIALDEAYLRSLHGHVTWFPRY